MRDNTDRKRRTFLKAVGGLGGASLIAGCTGDGGQEGQDGHESQDDQDDQDQEEEFPTEDIDLIIPYGSGGYDNYTRLVAPYVEEYLPNDVNVQPRNVEGAGGQVGTEQVYREGSDGHTNMIVNFQAFSLLQLLEDVDYDLAEMTWFGQIAENIGALGVGTNTDIHTFDEYAEAMRNEEIRIASESLTGGGTLIPLLLGEVSGEYSGELSVQNNVMFDGKGESLQAIMGGDAHVMAGSYSSILPYVESGDIRIILFLTQEDETHDPEHAPDADTLETADVENSQQIIDMAASRRHFAGPPEVDEHATSVLRDTYESAINDDEFLAEAEESELPINYAEGEEVAESVVSAMEMWEENRELVEMLVED